MTARGGDVDTLDLQSTSPEAAPGGAGGLVDPARARRIDFEEVLNADPGLAGDAREPRPYDFNRPHNMSRTFANNLQAAGESFAKVAAIDCTSLMRATVQVDYRGLHQCTFSEYYDQLPNPTCAAMLSLEPLKGQAILHIDLGLCFLMMQKLMGGPLDLRSVRREFTEIERGVNAGLIAHFAEILRKSLAKFTDTWPAVVKLENNPGYLGGYSDGEAFCVMRYLVKIGAVDGPVEIAVPFAAFGPVRDVFDPQGIRDTRSEGELRDDRRRILGLVQGTSSDLVVELGTTTSTLETILALREGDLLHLDQDVASHLHVVIEGQDTWLGEPGHVGNRRAVKLIRKLTKE